MPKETARHVKQRQLIRAFWHASKIREKKEAEAESFRSGRIVSVAETINSVKAEASKIIERVDVEAKEARSALFLDNFSELAGNLQADTTFNISSDAPLAELGKA